MRRFPRAQLALQLSLAKRSRRHRGLRRRAALRMPLSTSRPSPRSAPPSGSNVRALADGEAHLQLPSTGGSELAFVGELCGAETGNVMSTRLLLEKTTAQKKAVTPSRSRLAPGRNI